MGGMAQGTHKYKEYIPEALLPEIAKMQTELQDPKSS